MEVVEKQGGARKAGRTRAEEPEGEASRPLPGSPSQVRPAASSLDLARQEKSLEALGRMLKTKREINGLTRRDVVLKIKIPMDQLESIEDGRLSSLPPVFAKGFLRAYANELGLDAEAILDDYRKMTGGFKNEPASRDALASRYVETKMGTGFWRPVRQALATLVALLLVLAIVGAAAFWVRPDLWRKAAALLPFNIPVLEAMLAEPAGEPEALAEPAAGGPEVAVASGRLAVSAPAETAAPAPDETGTPAETGAPPPATEAPAAKGGELTLVSQKDGVWLQLIVDGQPVKHYWLKRGQTIIQRAETAVVVRTSQATSLNAVWNGRDLGVLSGQNGQPVIEISFPPG